MLCTVELQLQRVNMETIYLLWEQLRIALPIILVHAKNSAIILNRTKKI